MKKRTAVVLLVIAVIVVVVFHIGFNTPKGKGILPVEDKVSEKLDKLTAEAYFADTDLLYDDKTVTQNGKVVGEFVIVNSGRAVGVEFINVRVFSNGIGEMIRKSTNNEIMPEGWNKNDIPTVDVVYDKHINLSVEQTGKIYDIIERNRFWDIPSKHPEEKRGLDGNTIFIEGISGGKYNVISMWCPEKGKEIRQIYDEIMVCADSWGLKME